MDKKTFSKKFETPGWFYHKEILKVLRGNKIAALSGVLWSRGSLGLDMERIFYGFEPSIGSKCNLLYLMTRDEVAG